MPSSIEDIIKSKAGDLGFFLTGICNPEILSDEGEKLKKWISKGYHADMKWFERTLEKRIDPSKVLQEVKSILVFGFNYYKETAGSGKLGTGKISRYAIGEDYHEIIAAKLSQLTDFLKTLKPDIKALYYTDTGPLMEKVLAQRAGLGWIGKNTNLINVKKGSYFFLGCILTDIDLKFDKMETDHCGTCRKCIDACPTAAIVEPYQLDSGKCISYLTIEYRGDKISETFKGKFEGWIFGCDICQEVCPWNCFAAESNELFPIIDHEIDIEKWKSITEEEFKNIFKSSPIKRAKHKGFLRNLDFIE